MSSHRKKRARERELEKETDYYDLHKQAVEDLVTADVSNSPVVSKKELRKFRGAKKIRIPNVVKALFIKWWFNGAVCFFFLWGLGMFVTNILDQLFILAIAMGIVTDLLVNNSLRFVADPDGSLDKYMMFPNKKFVFFFLNILYAFLVVFFVFEAYTWINMLITSIPGNESGAVAFLGVGPLIFGTIYLGFDMLFIGMKRLFLKIVADAKEKNR
ncbi:MAG: hypothetical protein ILP08_04025 [Lachnospiraceae bacterium]|nr:hypothetical protein [Lachnospiraceae bacterium]MBQ3903019.1 hypothetical protein [Lachnospiraceae bacterium]